MCKYSAVNDTGLLLVQLTGQVSANMKRSKKTRGGGLAFESRMTDPNALSFFYQSRLIGKAF